MSRHVLWENNLVCRPHSVQWHSVPSHPKNKEMRQEIRVRDVTAKQDDFILHSRSARSWIVGNETIADGNILWDSKPVDRLSPLLGYEGLWMLGWLGEEDWIILMAGVKEKNWFASCDLPPFVRLPATQMCLAPRHSHIPQELSRLSPTSAARVRVQVK
jgi:hypothetical protein